MREIISKIIRVSLLIMVVAIDIAAIITKDAFNTLIIGLVTFYGVFVVCTVIIALLSLGEMGRNSKKE